MEELLKHKAVLDYTESESYFYLKVRPYGNASFFGKISEYPVGNVSIHDDESLKVNIRK